MCLCVCVGGGGGGGGGWWGGSGTLKIRTGFAYNTKITPNS